VLNREVNGAMDYRKPHFIKDHAQKILEFYKPICLDRENGGFFCAYLNDGTVYDEELKDFIGASRFMLDFCFGIFLDCYNGLREYIRHGLEFVEIVHRDEIHGGYHQNAKGVTPVIANKMTYGHAFYLCALSNAYKAGVKETYSLIDRVFNFMESKLYDREYGLYVDECSNSFNEIIPYRGQNCNMHMTEACLAAFEATGKKEYLERAYQLAHKITVELSKQCNGLICEHYNTKWEVDLNYNKDVDKYDLRNLLRPYGLLPGHFAEWSKLLLILERYRPNDWMLPVAENLFHNAITHAWDERNGGMVYAIDEQGNIVDHDRHFWTHAEVIAAAASLAMRTGNEHYWDIYDRVWDFSYEYFSDNEKGGWYRILDINKKPIDDKKSPPPKSDYHVLGACYEIMRSFHNYGLLNAYIY
jgi:mannose/cellobiose epimerase-like protein (N-acyl-D-glucosamine 2-epimerase family)